LGYWFQEQRLLLNIGSTSELSVATESGHVHSLAIEISLENVFEVRGLALFRELAIVGVNLLVVYESFNIQNSICGLSELKHDGRRRTQRQERVQLNGLRQLLRHQRQFLLRSPKHYVSWALRASSAL